MDDRRPDDAMTDAGLERDIERDIERVLSVEPSPQFLARVRAEIAAQPERMPWRSILKGTLFTAAAISVLSLGMSVFLGAAGGAEQQHFGSTGMALLVLFAVWLFLSNAALLVGYFVVQED